LESIIRKLWIHTLKAQLGVRQFMCKSLAQEFETPTITFEQRTAIAHRWDDTLQESHVLQLMIELLERQSRKQKTAR
jgi:hypothetical protein